MRRNDKKPFLILRPQKEVFRNRGKHSKENREKLIKENRGKYLHSVKIKHVIVPIDSVLLRFNVKYNWH